jgi:hypothetical protein
MVMGHFQCDQILDRVDLMLLFVEIRHKNLMVPRVENGR